MNQDKFFQIIDGIQQTSPGLKAYLNVALKSLATGKNTSLGTDHHQEFPLTFIEKGNLKTTLESKINPDHKLVRLHFQHEVIPPFIIEENDDFTLRTEAMEDSVMIVIPKKHIYTLYQNFPEFHILKQKIAGLQLNELLHHVLELQVNEVAGRLENLLKWKPDIFQIAQINDVARYLGTHPNNLSTIRNKKT